MYKKGMFEGFSHVFSFTAVQTMKGKGFKAAIIGISIFIFAIAMLINITPAIISKDAGEEHENSEGVTVIEKINIDEIYVLGQLEFPTIADGNGASLKLDNKLIMAQLEEKHQEIKYYYEAINESTVGLSEQSADKLVEDIRSKYSSKENSAIVILYTDEEGQVVVEIAGTDNLYEGSLGTVGDYIYDALQQLLMNEAGITPEIMVELSREIYIDHYEAGEDRNIAVMLVKMMLPMLVCLIIYMMIIINGQSITKAIVAEKTSKLLETLLTSVRPYGVIAGKVVAMATIAIAQMAIWIGAGVIGFMVGNNIGTSINEEFKNPVFDIINLVRENANGAFRMETLIAGAIFAIVGFGVYCVLAAFAGALTDKAEDLSNTSGIFQLPVVIAFLVGYMAPILGNDLLINIARYCPVTSPFIVPADMIVGNMSMIEGIISFVLLLAAAVVITIITGKIYKGRVFGKS